MIDFLVFMHIVFVALLLFAIGVLNWTSVLKHRTEDVREFAVHIRLAETAGMVSGISAVLAGVFGAWAASEIGYSMTAGWLVAAYAAVGAALVVPVTTLKPWGEKAVKLMPQALSEGRILPEQRELVLGRRHTAIEIFLNFLLVFIIFDMVYKPF